MCKKKTQQSLKDQQTSSAASAFFPFPKIHVRQSISHPVRNWPSQTMGSRTDVLTLRAQVAAFLGDTVYLLPLIIVRHIITQ